MRCDATIVWIDVQIEHHLVSPTFAHIIAIVECGRIFDKQNAFVATRKYFIFAVGLKVLLILEPSHLGTGSTSLLLCRLCFKKL